MPIESGPCTWPDLTQLCCDDWADFSTELQTQALDFAKTFVWAATGRQFGLCELTVRPCGRTCESCPNGWTYDGQGSWMPYIWNGLWKNCYCGSGPGCCDCSPECIVYLPGPVNSIVSVQVGGETLPVTGAYFVLDQRWLVRVDTEACWPDCSNQNLYPGDPNAFEVTYLRGLEVPSALAAQTSNLACQYARACVGLPCDLPMRIQSLSRQGVTISGVDINEMLKHGLSGIWPLDQLLLAYNPYGLKAANRLFTPDIQLPRQVTWP